MATLTKLIDFNVFRGPLRYYARGSKVNFAPPFSTQIPLNLFRLDLILTISDSFLVCLFCYFTWNIFYFVPPLKMLLILFNQKDLFFILFFPLNNTWLYSHMMSFTSTYAMFNMMRNITKVKMMEVLDYLLGFFNVHILFIILPTLCCF